VGINDLTTTLTPDDVDLSQLVIVKSKTSVRTDDVIISEVNEVFQDYFSQDETELGMTISFSDLNSGILGVDGVVSIKTTRTDSDLSYNGLSIVSWNPVYEQDIEALLRNKTYEYFQVPYLNNKDEFIDKIIVEVEE